MTVVVCDVCDIKIPQPRTHDLGVKMSMCLFQTPETFKLEEVDLCLSCALQLSGFYVRMKEKWTSGENLRKESD
jgi:hypothetical protein